MDTSVYLGIIEAEKRARITSRQQKRAIQSRVIAPIAEFALGLEEEGVVQNVTRQFTPEDVGFVTFQPVDTAIVVRVAVRKAEHAATMGNEEEIDTITWEVETSPFYKTAIYHGAVRAASDTTNYRHLFDSLSKLIGGSLAQVEELEEGGEK
jgi:hypothetical protein